MFATIGRSWKFAKIAYGIIWDFKVLLVFPVLSGLATLAVLASFILPLWGLGTLGHLESLAAQEGAERSAGANALAIGLTFAYYFCTYFVIVFFNTALTFCAMRVIGGQVPTVSEGLSAAGKRLGHIAGWALVSAVVGVLLKSLESSGRKGGTLVSSVLGTAWTVMTFFVLPVMVAEGVGPVQALKRSMGTVRGTWGTALVGNFSVGLIAVLLMLPVLALCVLLGAAALAAESTAGLVAVVLIAVVLAGLVSAAASAADVVFKALLYNYATGKTLPAGVDTSEIAAAFKPKGK